MSNRNIIVLQATFHDELLLVKDDTIQNNTADCLWLAHQWYTFSLCLSREIFYPYTLQ